MLYGIPVSLLVSGTVFPIGGVIYWTTTNLFSLGQQAWVLRKYPPPPMAGKSGAGAAAKTATGGKAPVKASSGSLTDLILGRKPKPEPATNGAPKVDGKALGPKVGAKPVNPKKAPANAAAPKPANPAEPGKPTTATPSKAVPGKTAPSKAKRPTG